jgi:hypothetical protein
MGPGGSGLPGALGACAPARMMDANRKIAGNIRWNKRDPFSVLSSQNWMCFLVLWIRNFLVVIPLLPLPLVEQVDGFEDRVTHDFEAFGA